MFKTPKEFKFYNLRINQFLFCPLNHARKACDLENMGGNSGGCILYRCAHQKEHSRNDGKPGESG